MFSSTQKPKTLSGCWVFSATLEPRTHPLSYMVRFLHKTKKNDLPSLPTSFLYITIPNKQPHHACFYIPYIHTMHQIIHHATKPTFPSIFLRSAAKPPKATPKISFTHFLSSLSHFASSKNVCILKGGFPSRNS